MQFTANYNLPCPDDQDYAAMSVYMQRLAEDTEAIILAQRSKYNDFAIPPTFIGTLNFQADISSPGGFFGMSTDTVIFSNFASLGLVSSGIGQGNNMFPEAGIWQLGWYLTCVELGAITADSFRQIEFIVRKQTASGTDLVAAKLSRRIIAEGVAGGSQFGSYGMVNIPIVDRALYNANVTFTHGNTGSQIRISPYGYVAWMRRVGSADEIEVV